MLNAAKGNSLEQSAPSSSFRSIFSRFELEADGQTNRNSELIDLDNTQQTLSPLTASIGIDERPHGAVSMNWDQRPETPASTANISLGLSVDLLSSSTPQPASDSSTTSSNPPQPSLDSSTTSSNPHQPSSDSSTTSSNPPQPSSDSSTTSSNPPQPSSDSSTTSSNPPQPSGIPPMPIRVPVSYLSVMRS